MTPPTASQIPDSLLRQGLSAATTLNGSRRKRLGDWSEWNKDVPRLGGVYTLWKASNPVYVGETCNLWDRIYEMAQRGRHGALSKLLSPADGQVRGVAITNVESVRSLEISWLPIELGRKEIEEYLIARWRRTVVNKEDGRFRRRDDADAYNQLAST